MIVDASTYDWLSAQVQAARDCLSKPADTFHPLLIRMPDGSFWAINLGDREAAHLVGEIVSAAIAMADRGGIGSDEVVRIAREIKAMREKG